MIARLEAHLGALADALSQVRPGWVAVALALQIGNLVARSIAWRNVLGRAFPDARIGVGSTGRAYAIGVGLNGWLPARAGDAAKVAIVRTSHPGTNAVAIAASCAVLVTFDSIVALALAIGAIATGAVPLPSLGTLVDRLSGSLPLVIGAGVLLAVALGVASRALGPRLRSALAHARQGAAVVRQPLRWARTVASMQLVGWCCRIGVVYCMLAAFGIPATAQLAALVVVVGGMSTLVPVPGGAGAQQALAAFALAGVAPASQAVAYSVGTQLGVTAVNSTLALLAAMWAFGHLHPVRAARAALAAGRPVRAPGCEPVPDPAT